MLTLTSDRDAALPLLRSVSDLIGDYLLGEMIRGFGPAGAQIIQIWMIRILSMRTGTLVADAAGVN